MPLSIEDFVTIKTNWNPKVQSLQEIAQELDINLDSLVFLDDNPVEREMVRSELPQVYTPEFPKNSSEYASFLRQLYVFEKNVYTLEDTKKTKIYKEQVERVTLQKSSNSLEDFWKNLEMQLVIKENDKDNIARLAQLTQKTNQFNVTTKRYSESDIEKFMADENISVFSWSLIDKFGDNGIVGLMVVKISGEDALVDVLLQSCRIIGRTVEQVVISVVAENMQDKGVKKIQGEYIATPKNIVVKDLFKNLGFSKESEGTFTLNIADDIPAMPVCFNKVEKP